MDLISLAGVVGELTPLLTGASVQKVQQPDKSSVYIQFFSRSGAFKLRIATDHTAPRFHISTRKDQQPPSPLGFCQVARKHIEDAICTRIEMPGPDRIVWMHFENRSPDPKGDSRCALIFELMGRNSNLILVGNSGVVRGVLRPIAATSPRPLKIGQKYTDPPGLRTDVDGSYGPLVDREAAALGGPENRALLLTRALRLPHTPVLVADADGSSQDGSQLANHVEHDASNHVGPVPSYHPEFPRTHRGQRLLGGWHPRLPLAQPAQATGCFGQGHLGSSEVQLLGFV